MMSFFRVLAMREREEVRARMQDLRRAFDVLGNTYAPLFFCLACVHGVALVVLFWTAGGVLNALLGARGIGTVTSELMRAMWTLLIAGVIWEASRILLSRLSGKLLETLFLVARTVQALSLVLFLFTSPKIGFLALICAGVAYATRRTTWMHVTSIAVWFLVTAWIFFALSADVTLRVITMGEAVRMVALFSALFVLFTRNAFVQKA